MFMTLSRFLVLMTLILSPLLASAQKVKYKDIYAWLTNKQYSEAEPFLKRYLKENDDNPNAFLYMGLIFEQNALKNDVLKEGDRSVANMDSATLFLDKAYKTVTEKELKRNDEYYETFKRRDLRTGEYGVKLSDIQFFIEKKQQELRERTDKVKLVNFYFSLSDSMYRKSQSLYLSFRDTYASTRSLLLRAEQPTVELLEALSDRFDSCTKAFDIFKTNLQSLGKTTYSQQIELREIKNLEKDGEGRVDFFANELLFWDYKNFADKSIKTIRDEITPLRDHLLSADIDINRLREKMERDSVSVRLEMSKLSGKLQHEKLRAFDSEPLPAAVFNAKIAEINYKSDLFGNASLRDSADIRFKLTLATQELTSVKVLDSLAGLVTSELIDSRSKDYAHFITSTYSNDDVLRSYIRGLQEFAKRERTLKEFEVSFRKKGLQWLLVGMDSIALLPNPGLAYAHQPLAVVEEKLTTGLVFKDSITASGYLYSITPSRKPDVSVTFPVEKNVYKHSTLSKAHAFILADPGNQIFFVILYSDAKVQVKDKATTIGKVSVTVAKIYRSDGLAWSSNFLLDINPTTATFANGELILTSDNGTNWVLDKNGKMKP